MKKLNLKSEIILWLIMLVPLVYLVLTWDQLPERVPTHFNLQGEADGWSRKLILASFVLFATAGSYLFMLFLPKLDPKRRLESMGVTYYRLRVLLVLYTSALVTYIIYIATTEDRVNINLMSFLTGALLAILGNYLPAVKPNYFIGIRTPWTLESENVWRKTHRFSGPLFVIGGTLYALTAFIDNWIMNAFSGIPILAIIILAPVIYSYIEFKKEQKMKHNA